MTWIMFRSFVISLIPNSPKAVSISDGISLGPAVLLFFFIFIEGLFKFPLKNLEAFLIIDDRWWSSWYSSVMYSDHLLRMSSFSIKMSPSFDRMHLVFAVAFFPCDLFYLLVYSFAVYSIVVFYFLTLCVNPMFLCFIAPLFHVFV